MDGSELHANETGEPEAERNNRNLSDLLQELRVAGLGVQVLFGFLLSLPFTVRFKQLDALERALYRVSLLSAALAIALLVSPVAYHRWVFRRHEKGRLLRYRQYAGHCRAGHGRARGVRRRLAGSPLRRLELADGTSRRLGNRVLRGAVVRVPDRRQDRSGSQTGEGPLRAEWLHRCRGRQRSGNPMKPARMARPIITQAT